MSCRLASRARALVRKSVRPVAVFVVAGTLTATVVSYGYASTASKARPRVGSATGYWVATTDGTVDAYGDARSYGNARAASAPIVGMASVPGLPGYWVVNARGSVSSFGKAGYFGSVHWRLARPVVGIAATPSGKGYWLVARDGGVFAFGDARFAGSPTRLRRRATAEGISATPDGKGYWLVTRNGGVFSFGNAHFFGSAAPGHMGSPAVGIASTPDGDGYWLAAANGHVKAFGDAVNYGSASLAPHDRVVAIASAPGGTGYLLATRNGEVLGFGTARWASARAKRPFRSPRKVAALAGSSTSPARGSRAPHTRVGGTGRDRTAATTPARPTTTVTVASSAPVPVTGVSMSGTTRTTTSHSVSPTTTSSPTAVPPTTTTLGPTTPAAPTTNTVAPTTTSAPTTASTSCTHPAFQTSSPPGIWYDAPYYVFNNMWNDTNPSASGPGTQSLYACSYSKWYVVSDQPAPGQPANSVKTYPNVQENFSSVPVSQFSALSSTFAETDPHVGDYEDAYDIWLNGIASSTSNEVMIWNENYGQTPAGSDIGSVTLDGHRWAVYTTANHGYTAFVASSKFTSGTLNLLNFFNYLIGQGLLPANTVVDQVDYGAEICSTGAQPATFSFNNFSIDATY